MGFLCSSCGACCLAAGSNNLMPDRGDGACIHLNKNNKCNIYEKRPDICRVKGSKKDWIKSTKICHILIDSYGLDEKYKIDLKLYDLE